MNFFSQSKFYSLTEAITRPGNCKVLHINSLDINLAGKGADFLKLENLQELYIQADPIIYDLCDFELPSTIGQLSKLKTLSLLNLAIKIFPAWITTLPNLEYLMVRGTDVTEIPESISKLKKLKTLRVENCPLTKLPLSLREMDNLKKIELCDTKLTHLSPELFPKNLKYLNFSGTGCYNPKDLDKLHMQLRNTTIYPPARDR